MLDSHWDADYSNFTNAHVLNALGQPVGKEVETSFGIQLKMLAWIPATATTSSEPCHVGPTTLVVGRNLFMPIQDILDLFTDHLSYLNAEVSDKSGLALYVVGVRRVVDVTDVRNQLFTWCRRSDDSSTVRMPTTFRTSLFHMSCVYNYLRENLTPKQMQV